MALCARQTPPLLDGGLCGGIYLHNCAAKAHPTTLSCFLVRGRHLAQHLFQSQQACLCTTTRQMIVEPPANLTRQPPPPTTTTPSALHKTQTWHKLRTPCHTLVSVCSSHDILVCAGTAFPSKPHIQNENADALSTSAELAGSDGAPYRFSTSSSPTRSTNCWANTLRYHG